MERKDRYGRKRQRQIVTLNSFSRDGFQISHHAGPSGTVSRVAGGGGFGDKCLKRTVWRLDKGASDFT